MKKSLYQWCLENDTYGKELIKSWTGIETDKDGNVLNTNVDISSISYASGKYFVFRCKNNHETHCRINIKTYRKTGCNKCRASKILGKSLYEWCIEHGDFGIEVMNEWTGIQVDKDNNIISNNIDIHNIGSMSNKRMLFKCINGHSYSIDISHKTYGMTKCPKCTYIQKGRDSIYSALNDCLKNQLKQAWTGIEVTDGFERYNIDYNDVPAKSNRKFKFICDNGHCFIASAHDIYYRNCICTSCKTSKSSYGTSYPELVIYFALKQIFEDAQHRVKVLKSKENKGGIEFDIAIPSMRLCIEYSPTGWHKNRWYRDEYKRELCKVNNVRLIEIIDDSYNEFEHGIYNDTIVFKMGNRDKTLKYIINKILILLNVNTTYDYSLASSEALKQIGCIDYEKSLKSLFPNIAREYSSTNELSADKISAYSNKKAYWTCTKCGYGSNNEWEAVVASRTYMETACPNCRYSILHDTYKG